MTKLAKKKTTKKKSTNKEPTFEDMCKRYRVAKIRVKNAQKEMDKWVKAIKNHAIEEEISGELHGLKFMRRFSFASKENLAVAKKLGIPIPSSSSLYLSGDEKLLKQQAKKLGVSEDLVQTSPNLKALEKYFEDNNIEGSYNLSIALGLGTVE